MDLENIAVGNCLKVFAGSVYIGEVTEVKEHGFWLTEEYKTEEFISFADIIEISVQEKI